MKKSLLFLAMAAVFMPAALAQTKDNVARECVLFELFTGVRCPYCPAAANAVAQMLEEGKAIAPVGYHTTAFSTAEYYTNETNARASYYNISSYPTLKADGITGISGGGNASQNMYSNYMNYYNQRINVASPFTIDLSFVPVDGTTCRVNCVVNQVGDCNGNDVRVFIALTQSNIDVSWQGMQGLHHVCRDMIPTQTGTPFTGPTLTVSETFEMLYPKEDCYLTAWVQNYSGGSKEVYQAVRLSTAMDLDYDLVLTAVDNVLENTCSGFQKPALTVRNSGNQAITSFDMCAFDGQEVFRQQWQGTLESGATITVEMDEFQAVATESLQFYVEKPNGQGDGFEADNYKTVNLNEAAIIDGFLKMQLKTGSHPENVTVEIKSNTTGELVSFITFEQANHVYNQDIELLNADCYRITVSDVSGEGMGNGFFQFKDASNNVILRGGGAANPFTYAIATEVNCDGTLSVDEPAVTKTVVYPNPTQGMLNLDLGEGLWMVQIYDITGRKVLEHHCDAKSTLDLSQQPKGLYFLKARKEAEEISAKFLLH